MKSDPIIEEIHRARQEHAERFNYDISAIFNDLKDQERKSGRRFVSLPIKQKMISKDIKTEL